MTVKPKETDSSPTREGDTGKMTGENVCAAAANRIIHYIAGVIDEGASFDRHDVERILREEYNASIERVSKDTAELEADLREARAQREWLIKECARVGVTVNVQIGAPLTEAYRLVNQLARGAPQIPVASTQTGESVLQAKPEPSLSTREAALVEALEKALDMALDEVWFTFRPKGYGELHCAMCKCNISQQETHGADCYFHKLEALALLEKENPASRGNTDSEDSKAHEESGYSRSPVVQSPSVCAGCMDCQKPYPFGLDLVLPDQQWKHLVPGRHGVLCPNCIAARADKLKGATVILAWIDHFDWTAPRPKEWFASMYNKVPWDVPGSGASG